MYGCMDGREICMKMINIKFNRMILSGKQGGSGAPEEHMGSFNNICTFFS